MAVPNRYIVARRFFDGVYLCVCIAGVASCPGIFLRAVLLGRTVGVLLLSLWKTKVNTPNSGWGLVWLCRRVQGLRPHITAHNLALCYFIVDAPANHISDHRQETIAI